MFRGGENFMRFYQLSAIAAVTMLLGACINSDYDLAATMKPEFPVRPGNYVKADGSLVEVRRHGNGYRVNHRKDKTVTYARLFKIPEYPDYILQYYDRKEKPIVFLFLKTTEKGFEVYDIGKLPSVVPGHLVKLLVPITEGDREYNNITIANGRRDTLYILREIARANLAMHLAESFERRR
jgi:hypothetical protein